VGVFVDSRDHGGLDVLLMADVVDIVIPVHNALEYLQVCVDSIFRYTPADLFELILVNDWSRDPTLRYLEELKASDRVTILHTPDRYWFTKTCNMGLQHATHDKMMLLNSDIEVGSDWLQLLVDCMNRHDAGVVGCKHVWPTGKIWHAGAYGAGTHVGMLQENHDFFDENEPQWVTGAMLLIRRDVVDEIGYLPEQWRHAESDREFCLAASRAGFKIVYSPVTLTHYVGMSND
jgi:GT2 family glycosyltransferase